MTNPRGIGQFDQYVYSREYEYDFAVDGGAIGAINMRSAQGALPAGAVVIAAALEILTSFVAAAGTTTTAGIEAANDLQASADPNTFTAGRIAVGSNGVVNDIGLVDGLLFASANLQTAGVIKTTVARTPRLTVAVHALTAGKAKLVLQFYV